MFFVGILIVIVVLGINIVVENIVGVKFLFIVKFMELNRLVFFFF